MNLDRDDYNDIHTASADMSIIIDTNALNIIAESYGWILFCDK